MKPYINEKGKIYLDEKSPPTNKEYQDFLCYLSKNYKLVLKKPKPIPVDTIKSDALAKYINEEIKVYTDIVSILERGGSIYEDTLTYAADRIRELGNARLEILQNQPPDDVARSINVHYSEILHSYI